MDLDSIQGNVVPGFSKDYQAFVLARFHGPGEARAWLSGIQPHLASAREVAGFNDLFRRVRDRSPHPHASDRGALSHLTATWVNLGLSFAGLRVLRGAAEVGRFSPSFRQSRVPGADPAEIQGDVHALLIVAADQPEDLEGELRHHRELMTSRGVEEVKTLCGATLPGDLRGHEQFGFKDAISQPLIAGTDWGCGPPVAPGEFVLGYPDQTGLVSGMGLPAWTRNGSFVAFLQLEQHVATFRDAMRQQAQRLGVKPDDLAAWIVGRTTAGAQLSDPPARLSHIGRAYSRWLPASEASRHRILRRGIPYGSPLTDGEPDDGGRGLLFVAYQADLERQFEHVWTQWLNAPGFPLPGAGRDALVGQTAALTDGAPGWNRNDGRQALTTRRDRAGGTVALSLPAFVTGRYGGYFFSPSIDALSGLTATGRPQTQTAV